MSVYLALYVAYDPGPQIIDMYQEPEPELELAEPGSELELVAYPEPVTTPETYRNINLFALPKSNNLPLALPGLTTLPLEIRPITNRMNLCGFNSITQVFRCLSIYHLPLRAV